MQAWLSAYSTTFNRRHRRSGHLFQNRFKSTLVEEEPYLRQLLAYIHLNPVRARLPVTLEALDRYPWTGHAVLLGNHLYPAQDTDFVLALFGASTTAARAAYRRFVHELAHRGQPCDLDGGGLRRSVSGWRHHERLRVGRERWASDERVLGTTEFVQQLLGESAGATVTPAQPAALIQPLVAVICARFGVAPGELGSRSLRPRVLAARAALSYAAVMHHSLSFTAVAQHVGLSRRSISRAIARVQVCGLTDIIPRAREHNVSVRHGPDRSAPPGRRLPAHSGTSGTHHHLLHLRPLARKRSTGTPAATLTHAFLSAFGLLLGRLAHPQSQCVG